MEEVTEQEWMQHCCTTTVIGLWQLFTEAHFFERSITRMHGSALRCVRSD